MSGAGKSVALSTLEDLGFYCVDNLLPSLICEVARICAVKAEYHKIAMCVDIRGGSYFEGIFTSLRLLSMEGYDYKLLYIDASDEVLINRYRESRREHPLAYSGKTSEAIKLEREKLSALKAEADIIIDTSGLTNSQLRQKLSDMFGASGGAGTELISFGFKRGVPNDCDVVLDVRFLPNPHSEPTLRARSGMSGEVSDYVFIGGAGETFCTAVADMISCMLPQYHANVKKVLTIAVGCTGGKHRSVAVCQRLRDILVQRGITAGVTHRDLYME